MDTQPQPPPNAPDPCAVAICSRRKWQALWIVGIIILGVVALLGNGILVQRNKAAIAEAHGNLRSLSCSLMEFDHEYGRLPDSGTIAMVRENTESLMPMGTRSSNDFLRQLIAAEIQVSEVNCHAAIPGTHKPDSRSDGSHALGKGECGFSYILGQSSKSNPDRPLVVTPLIPGTDRFDPKPFNGYAVVLKIGGCATGDVRVLPITKNGEVIDDSGKHILDPANPIWGGEKPGIAWPE